MFHDRRFRTSYKSDLTLFFEDMSELAENAKKNKEKIGFFFSILFFVILFCSFIFGIYKYKYA
jgi:hypothetical protein